MFGTASYTYDVLDNLTRMQVGATAQYAARDHDYCYDAKWQPTNIKTGGCSGGSTVIAMLFDAQGNLQNRSGRTYDFDFGNRLRGVSASGPVPASSYLYDGHGRRVQDTVGGKKDSLYDREGKLVYVNDNRAASRGYYIYLQGSLVARHEKPDAGNWRIEYQHTDALGTPVAVTDEPA